MSDVSSDAMEQAVTVPPCDPAAYSSRRVAVAMSGGVDSTVAAALLIDAGFEVAGYTMRLFPADSAEGDIATVRAAEAARRLGIEHHVVDLTSEFDSFIATNFMDEYIAGRTPNPCVLCNHLVKWRLLGKTALADGWELFATGHYVRIARFPDDTCTLLSGNDTGKDQSYFLWRLTSAELERTVFPLGAMKKHETREHARRLGLDAAEHAESQEICFIPDNDYRGYLDRRVTSMPPPLTMTDGDIIDRNGHKLGRHRGAAYYTIGQRRGLGIAASQPLYVTALDAGSNTVTLGPREQLASSALRIRDMHWIRGFPPSDRFRCSIRIRYRHPGAAGTIDARENTVVFDDPQDAVTPGQSAVFYDGDFVLGGGIIENPL